jgi:hypothetical protein
MNNASKKQGILLSEDAPACCSIRHSRLFRPPCSVKLWQVSDSAPD